MGEIFVLKTILSKVENLVNALHDQLKTISFCWVDKTNHMACEQSGVVRTNCVDCLDRTNVVQVTTALQVFYINGLLKCKRLSVSGLYFASCMPPTVTKARFDWSTFSVA